MRDVVTKWWDQFVCAPSQWEMTLQCNIVSLAGCTHKMISVRCYYNAVNFLENPHNTHPIASLWGWDMGCHLWPETVIQAMPELLQFYVVYHLILVCIIKAPDCIWFKINVIWVKCFVIPDPWMPWFHFLPPGLPECCGQLTTYWATYWAPLNNSKNTHWLQFW